MHPPLGEAVQEAALAGAAYLTLDNAQPRSEESRSTGGKLMSTRTLNYADGQPIRIGDAVRWLQQAAQGGCVDAVEALRDL